MGVPTSEVSYTSATAGRGDHEVHKGHEGAWGEGSVYNVLQVTFFNTPHIPSHSILPINVIFR
jgi:hypothetical protein